MTRRRLLVAVVAVYSMLAIVSVGAQTASVAVPGGAVTVVLADWKPMENPEVFATNFEARHQSPGEAFAQVDTIFKLKMTEHDRLGIQVSDGEWVEFMFVHPGKVACQIRLDKVGYWVMSRQTFDMRDSSSNSVEYRPFLSVEENRALLEIFDIELKRTRFVLQQRF